MQAASVTLTGEMQAVSTIVDATAGSAREMQMTTQTVLAAIAPIAETSVAQSETADAVSAATAELAAQVQQMDGTAGDLRLQASDLTDLVAAFKLGAEPSRTTPAPELVRHSSS